MLKLFLMALKKMSTTQYAELRGMSVGAVCKAIRKGHRTPGVVHYEMYGGTYILTVDEKILKKYLAGTNKTTYLS